MDKTNDRHGDIDGILREVYENTEPQDSWPALRGRIDVALSEGRAHSHSRRRQVVFWRRTALAMAACFVATAGLLLYVVSTDRRGNSLDADGVASAPALLTQTRMNQLVQAFSQVRGLFGDHQPWLMIDSTGTSQMGLTPRDSPGSREEGLIVLRLAVQEVGSQIRRRYADLVAYPRQQIAFSMQTAAGSVIELRVAVIPREDGQVDIDFVAQGDGEARTGRATGVGQNSFTSLTPIQIGMHGFSLGAMAKSVQLPEQG